MNDIYRAGKKAAQVLVEVAAKQRLRSLGVEFDRSLVCYGMPILSKATDSRIRLGGRVVLCSWSSYTALGVSHPVVMRTLEPGAELFVGDDVGMSGATICAARRVIIGPECMLGANVTITDTDFHPLVAEGRRYNKNLADIDKADVVVGRNVFIGMNSVVLKGVRIGDNSVIGAGSVVTSDVPENVVAAGNPCRVLRTLVTPAYAAEEGS